MRHEAQFTIEAEGVLSVEFNCQYDADDTEKPCAMWGDPFESSSFIPGCGLLEWHEADPSLYVELFRGDTPFVTGWLPITFEWLGHEGIASWERAPTKGRPSQTLRQEGS
jgi:hypothetical protein